MENTFNQDTNNTLSRRNLFKTGLALAGGSLLAPLANAQKLNSQKIETGIVRVRRKLGTLEVSSVALACRI